MLNCLYFPDMMICCLEFFGGIISKYVFVMLDNAIFSANKWNAKETNTLRTFFILYNIKGYFWQTMKMWSKKEKRAFKTNYITHVLNIVVTQVISDFAIYCAFKLLWLITKVSYLKYFWIDKLVLSCFFSF